MIKFYGYKKCGTCRKAEKVLIERNIEYTFVDITETPPSASTLQKIMKLADIEVKKLFNTSGVQYRELNIKNTLPRLTEKDILKMLSENGRLIKRPLVFDGTNATVGFNEALFRTIWT